MIKLIKIKGHKFMSLFCRGKLLKGYPWKCKCMEICKVKRELFYIVERMIKIEKIDIQNKYYPRKLKNIYDPPKELYIIGNKEILNKPSVAIIGCRECSEYGKRVAQKFAYELSKKEIVIVSGLAKGIDSFVHIGVLYAKGKTIAVLGSGLDNIYPKENIELAKKIVEYGGCIISEYPVGTKPEKKNFPQRNRIISGLSNGVVVVEASEKSGSLITVDFALEQGRDVFAVPGNILNSTSVGTNNLIKQGAKLVTNYMEILEDGRF